MRKAGAPTPTFLCLHQLSHYHRLRCGPSNCPQYIEAWSRAPAFAVPRSWWWLRTHLLGTLESVLSDSVDAKEPATGAVSPGRQVLRAAERVTKKIRKDPHRRRRYLAHVQSDTTICLLYTSPSPRDRTRS